MTLLDDPPVATPAERRAESPPARSAMAVWRFAARLARREVRRRPGRTTLVALLVAVPVMAMTLGSVLARTNADDWSADFRRDFDTADIVTGLPWFGVATEATGSSVPDVPAIPDGGTVLGEYVMVSTSITPADARPGDAVWADFTDLDPTNPAEWRAVEVTDGRAPVEGEVLLDDEIGSLLGVGIGDELVLDRPSGTWTVSGFGRMRGDYWRRLVVVPGFDTDRIVAEQRSLTTLIDLPDSTPPDEVARLAAERGGISRYDDPFGGVDDLSTGMAWGYVAGLLALVAIGIIVAAAFATSARRQLVTIGQLSANGAPESVVRRSLALQGTWTGLVGAVVGVAMGFALLPIARPLVADHIVQHELRATRVSITDLLIVALTAVVVATAAASVPARSAARVPIMAALAGRRPTGTPPSWLVPTGLALFAGGLGIVAVAALGADGTSGSANTWAGLVVLGATAMVFGVCCASPLVVERVGSLGRRTSLSWRMALRSLARSRARNAAVVAAIAVAVGGAVAAAAVAESAIRSNYACCDPTLPADTVRLDSWSDVPSSTPGQAVDLGPLSPLEVPDGFTELTESLGVDESFDILTATFDPVPYDPEMEYIDRRGPAIATPELLDFIGLSDADARRLDEVGSLGQSSLTQYGPVVAVAPDTVGGETGETMVYMADGGSIEVPFAASAEPSMYPWFSDIMMTESAARAAGFDIVRTGIVLRTGSPLDDEQLALVRAAQQQLEGRPLDAFVEPGDPPRTMQQAQMGTVEWTGTYLSYEDPSWRNSGDDELWIARGVVVGAALLLSLLVVSIALALAAAEGRDERNAFAVLGATPASMRRQAAASAAVMALVGIVLGVPLGFLPAWVVDRITHDDEWSSAVPVGFPWLVVGALAVVIPALAGAGASTASALAARFRPPDPARRD